MEHLLSSLVIIAVSLVGVGALQRFLNREERTFIWLSYLAHLVSALALLGVYQFFYGGEGDIFAYGRFAERINAVVATDPIGYLPELLKGFLRMESRLDPWLYSAGSSTGAMSAATAIGFLLTGNSLVGCCFLFAMMSFSSKVALYFALRDEIHPMLYQRLLLGLLLVPSAVFWTAGVVKEALAMFGLGWVIFGLSRLINQRRYLLGGLIVAGASVFVFSIKTYILMPLGAASGLYYTLKRLERAGRDPTELLKSPGYIFVGLGVTVGVFWLVGELFPRFSIDHIAKEAAQLQAYSRRGHGGSTFQMGSGQATTLRQQLAFVPIALVNSLFRPFIFEVHNAVALINGLETAGITILVAMSLKARGLRGLLEAIVKVPAVAFCLVFVLLFGMGVGLGTTNLGTLSRYRVPMMPFYVAVLLLLLPYGKLPWERE